MHNNHMGKGGRRHHQGRAFQYRLRGALRGKPLSLAGALVLLGCASIWNAGDLAVWVKDRAVEQGCQREAIALEDWMLLGVPLLIAGVAAADSRGIPIEKAIREHISSPAFRTFQAEGQCHGKPLYRVYLIDNFEQDFHLVPEVLTSHGEMLVKLLRTGREDIEVVVLNTSLSKGLAQVIHDLLEGACADAVVSSVPGSNYTYDQISSLFAGQAPIRKDNILYRRSALRQLLRDIALHGFPSVDWLKSIDINSVKLRNDAWKFVLIEALGRFHVPVILPYGNPDATYKGQIKSVNLLSLAANARVYSALDQDGERVPGFPYSPLSSGDEPAVYTIMECPHPVDPFKAVLDINNDGYPDYTFFRTGEIPYRNDQGQLDFAPPVTRQHDFAKRLSQIETDGDCRIDEEMVVTADQYRKLKALCSAAFGQETSMPYVWLNSAHHGRVYGFEPECRGRGTISGTSVIPPIKLQELLPPKRAQTPFENRTSGQMHPGG